MPKHERVVAAAKTATPPWDDHLEHNAEGCKLLLTRGDEKMVITWDVKDGLVHPLTYILRGVREIRLRNVAEALRYLAAAPDYRARSVRTGARTAAPRRAAGTAIPDWEGMTDQEVIKALRGKVLVWWNSMLETHDQGQVPDRYKAKVKINGEEKVVWRTSRNISMSTSSAGRRIITFPAVGEQFRSVGLDQIVSIK